METGRSSCTPRRWRVAPAEPSVVRALASAVGLSEVAARVLVCRGITDAADAERFLSPDIDRDAAEPESIPGMIEAAARVVEAVKEGQRVVVFGDFDLDGTASAALCALALERMGADVRAVVPHRFKEGYGLSVAALQRVFELEPRLVVTVDCGISAGPEVEMLRTSGVECVVTDHHEPGDNVPRGVPVANPKLGPNPSRDLAGVGVALKLVQAVGKSIGQPDTWREFLDLVALGTVADIVPLLGENRALVSAGIGSMRSSPRLGIAALAAAAGVSLSSLDAEVIAFALAPRLNAAGRMGDPEDALRLLMTQDAERAEQLAMTLEEHNRARQSAEQDLASAALAQAERVYRGESALVLAGDGWHEGVRGIVASRIAGEYGVPTLLFSIDESGEARGSGRTAGSIDLFSAVSRASSSLTRFGGHAAAVGCALPADALQDFARDLLRALDALPAETRASDLYYDAEAGLEDAGLELAAELERLAPHGPGNRRPLLVVRSVFMNGRQRVGRVGNHLRFTAFDGGVSVPAISFRQPDIDELLANEGPVDLAYELNADEWRGRRRVQLVVREIEQAAVRPGFEGASTTISMLIEDLFEHAEEIIAREEYAGIGDAESFNTKLAGVTFEGRQDVVSRLSAGTPLRPERQPSNEHDPNAIALFDPFGDQVGFFNRRLAAALAPVMDAGAAYDVQVTDVTGGEEGRPLGVNVFVSRRGAAVGAEESEGLRAERRAHLAELQPDELDEELTRLFLGEGRLHAAQAQALARLASGRSTLLVMATGRGKSVVFHLHAARLALRDAQASVFVYPLRALVSDQAFHLEEAFAEAGLVVRMLTGETPLGARNEAFASLADGSPDVVLTTPEFLEYHADRFASTHRVGFVVVDEAHHVAMAKAGHRPAYGRLGRALEALEHPIVLAASATAGDDTARAIKSVLGVEDVVLDPTVRSNLQIEDRRDAADKETYVCALAAGAEKMVVYVNSREQSVRLARALRKRVPAVAARTAFYNGGLSREARTAIEHAFRTGEVVAVIATSAFGEGVNIPDIRHVVHFHMPFGEVEFNQMSGRAGRDGASARVHLLFGRKDARINEAILSSLAPEREDLAALYLVLKDEQGTSGEGFEITNAEIAERARRRRRRFALDERGVSSALGILRELGLAEGEGHGSYRRLTLLPAPAQKLDLGQSVRYAEGLEEIAEFQAFKEWVLTAEPSLLLERFNRPILPTQP
jgi:single-stranded-DNA-specific exonuclease